MAHAAHTLTRPTGRGQIARPRTLRQLLGADWQLGWLFVAPVVLLVSGIIIYPFLDAILLSFQERFIGKTGTWVGLANYAALLSDSSIPWAKAAFITLAI